LRSGKVSDLTIPSRNIGNKNLLLRDTLDSFHSKGYEIMEESDEESPVRRRDTLTTHKRSF